jgi:hypothetical protein
MSDWNKQAQEMLNTWTKAQQQLWDTWKTSMPQAGTMQAGETWEKTVDFWKQAVDTSLNAQSEWANLWARSVAQANAPKELSAWTDQMASIMTTWTESQSQLWQGVLDSMKRATPETLVQRMDESTRAAFQAWQEAVQKAVEAQRELSKQWMGVEAEKKAS